MTIKQQGGIFGRNPTFNDTTSTDLTVLDKLGVQNSDPQAAVHIGSNSTFSGTAGYTTLLIADTSNGAQLSLRGLSPKLNFDSTGGNDCEVKFDNDLIFRDLFTDTERARLTSSGNLALPSGSGIDFSATSGTGTSELFDDYEEGTWTATLFDANSGGNASSTTATGYYTKIGRVVNCIVSKFNNVSTAGMSGTLRMSLPFTPSSGGFYSTGTASMEAGTFPANTYMLTVAVYHGEARAYLQAQGTNGFTSIGTTNITSGTTDLNQMTFSYIAA